MSAARRSNRLLLLVVGLLIFLAGMATATLRNRSIYRSVADRCRRRRSATIVATPRSEPGRASVHPRPAARPGNPSSPVRRHRSRSGLPPRAFSLPLHSAKPSGAGPLAHPVEQGTFNPKVQGSRPWRPTGAGYPAEKYGVVTVEAMLWSEAPAAIPAPASPSLAAPADPAPVDDSAVADDSAVVDNRAGGPDPDAGEPRAEDPQIVGVLASGVLASGMPATDVGTREPHTAAPDPAPEGAVRDIAADEAFLAEIDAELDAVQTALVRLDDGTFDRCQLCGGHITQEQLMADPLATRCSAHS